MNISYNGAARYGCGSSRCYKQFMGIKKVHVRHVRTENIYAWYRRCVYVHTLSETIRKETSFPLTNQKDTQHQ
jgi:hypothetical protein